MEIESTVNAEPVVNVEPQTTETSNVPDVTVESEHSEVTTEQPIDKPAQSKEDNAKYAEVRREAERKAQDRLISELYGDQGIHTKADYDRAIREQREAEMLEQLRSDDADPSVIKDQLYREWEQSDPRLREYEQIKTQNYVQTQLSLLNADLKEMGIDAVGSLDDIAKLPSADVMTRHIEQGKTLAEAYFLANKADIIKAQASKIQQDTIKKIQANGDTVGSLANTSAEPPLYTRDQVDKMTQKEVNQNYDLIMKSMKTWK